MSLEEKAIKSMDSISNDSVNIIANQKSIPNGNNIGNMEKFDEIESNVLVLYTGGTIGMIRNENNVLEPVPNKLLKMIREYPNMHDKTYALNRFDTASSMGHLVLPKVEGQSRRVIYTINEYDPILDSSNMTIQNWVQIAKDIQQSYQFFDGFVILHGTDTLSYTASALSFMLENLGKSVIITGSQIPIFETRTDGVDNFTSALIIAGNYVIPEVCVLFNSKLLRGNRTIKISSESLEAFNTPNVPAIANIGINVEVKYRFIFRPCTISKFTVHTVMDENVGILRLFPSISITAFKAFLMPPVKGVVLQSFGSGNIPSNREDIIDEIRKASDRGVLIINCTQCISGSVAEMYITGKVLYDIGVLSGFDMTPESALCKLSYVLGKNWPLETKKQMMLANLRGELTLGKAINIEEFDLIDAVARSLHLTSPKELGQLGATLFPAMINTAVQSADFQKLNNLKSYGADLSSVNYDQRSALHIACCQNNFDIVKYLLLNGVSVHLRDRYDRTALMDAISFDCHNIIDILIKCGAHLTGKATAIGDKMCKAASKGLVKRLESYKLAGADLSQCDLSGRTPMHLASLHNQLEVIKYLLKNNVTKNSTDLLGLTALDYAEKVKNSEVVNLLH